MIDQPKPVVCCLLVDDREQNLVALEAALRSESLMLLKARSGSEALELLLQHEVALALIDVQMPGMDGFELAELMRGSERTRRVPIMFLTAGNTDQQRRFRGYEAGAVDFLQKPIEMEILKSKAEVFFELHRQRLQVAQQRDELEIIIKENTRLLEESRQYAQALQDADRRKDEFLATLAHELRNPLAPILNAVQVIRFSASPEEIAACHEIIERQIHHTVRLVDDLLELSRITSDKIQLQLERIDLAEVLRHAIETSRPLMEANRHEFSQRLHSGTLLLEGDAVRLAQVFANLLNNAAKYTPEGGRISLEVERTDDATRVRIKDTGLGLPTEKLGEVFEMFTQINRHLGRSQGGLGIGLTLVKRLVELHQGSIEVLSEGEGLGSEFIVTLPLAARVDQTAEGESPGVAVPARPQRVLMVDDNADALASLRLLVKAHGHDVAIAHSGPEGIEQVSSFEPSIVLLDIGMPGMDGLDTAKHIRLLPNGKEIRLIALTGWGQDSDRARTRDAGFDSHLVKPVTTEKLLEILSGADLDDEEGD